MGDWIKLHRLLLEWEWYTTPNMAHFFVYCLLKASHKKRQWMGIELSEGQFISGRKVMSLETGLTEQEVRTCLERLKSTSEITSKTTNKYSIITINSWNKYQIADAPNQQHNQQLTNKQPASNHRQEGKKDKNEKKDTNTTVSVPETLALISGFIEAWEDWKTHLKEKKKKPTPSALRLQLKKLESIKDPIGAIRHSISNNWQGIFEPFNKQQKPDFVDDIKRVDAIMRKQYGIEPREDHPRTTQPMLCSAPYIPESGDYERGDGNDWE